MFSWPPASLWSTDTKFKFVDLQQDILFKLFSTELQKEGFEEFRQGTETVEGGNSEDAGGDCPDRGMCPDVTGRPQLGECLRGS